MTSNAFDQLVSDALLAVQLGAERAFVRRIVADPPPAIAALLRLQLHLEAQDRGDEVAGKNAALAETPEELRAAFTRAGSSFDSACLRVAESILETAQDELRAEDAR